MAHAALLLLGLAVALLGPRHRPVLLTLLTGALAAGVCTGLVFAGQLPLWGAALVFGLLALVVVLLPHFLPRGLLGLLFLVLLATLVPIARLPDLPRPATITLAALLLAGVVLGLLRAPDRSLRVACALLGARLMSQAFPTTEWWAPLVAVGVLLALDAALRSGPWPVPVPPAIDPLLGPARPVRAPAGTALAFAALTICVTLFGWRLLPVLPAPRAQSGLPALPPLPFEARRAALAATAPHGGLVWPLPSEALFWTEPNHDLSVQPRFDNLDSVYLGASARAFYRLPATTLRGALSLHGPLAKQRLIHDAASLARLRLAAQATVAALHDVLPQVRPGVPEKQVELAVLEAMKAHGCGRESFPLILASGPSAVEPHGSGNLGVLEQGTLLVADIGCTVDHYASDFTRTLPVSGKFDPEQRVLYEAVLAAQAAALAACKPGATLMGMRGPRAPADAKGGGSGAPPDPGPVSLTQLARATLREKAPDHQEHMPHGLGHTVGLFVHDVINDGALVEGMVITIEPGTYLEKKLGIRIEDTYLVTKDGCEPLTTGFPADAPAVEAAMAR